MLRLLALGHTNQEIAKQLFISVRTAETHRAHIMQKLRLTSRAELVRYAIDQGAARTVEAAATTTGRPEAARRVGGVVRDGATRSGTARRPSACG